MGRLRAGSYPALCGLHYGASGGGAGDLYLTIRLAGHPDLRVEGGNLSYDLDLAPWEAVLGPSVSVPTLEGEVSIKIPPGAQSGLRLRVRGRGLGKEGARGDLFVITRIQVLCIMYCAYAIVCLLYIGLYVAMCWYFIMVVDIIILCL